MSAAFAKGRSRAAIYTLAGSAGAMAIASLQALILTPLYLTSVGAHVYGLWLASGDVLMWMQALDLGLPNLMIQRIGAAHGRSDFKAVGIWFASGLLVLSAVAVVLGVAGVAVSHHLFLWLRADPHYVPLLSGCFAWTAVAVAVQIAANSVVGLARGVQDTAVLNAALIASSAASLVTGLTALLLGYGLWSAAFAALARAAVFSSLAGIFAVRFARKELRHSFRYDLRVARELIAIMPLTGSAGIAYAAMNQTELLLVNSFIGPEAVVMFSSTKKFADLIRACADTFGTAVYGGFASIIGSNAAGRALNIYRQIWSARLAVATIGISVYLALNQSIVSIWIGRQYYGGAILTSLIALQSIISGQSYLVNLLYRAAGHVGAGSALLVLEGSLRVAVAILLIRTIGVAAIPLAGVVIPLVFGLIVHRVILRQLRADGVDEVRQTAGKRAIALAAQMLPYIGGVALCFSLGPQSLRMTTCLAFLAGIVSAGLAIFGDEVIRETAFSRAKAWIVSRRLIIETP